jgi:hypothetical protein
VSASYPTGSCPGYPKAARVLLGDALLWEFNGTDYGAFGSQDSFVYGRTEWTSSFGPAGGSGNSAIRLPKKAVVQNATMEIAGSGPLTIEENINYSATSKDNLFGWAVSGAGDVDNDSYDEVIVGAWDNGPGGGFTSHAYIFDGGPGKDNQSDVILGTGAWNDAFGRSVSDAGDVNNDGFDDVIVSAHYSGKAYIFFGGSPMDGTPDVILSCTDRFENFSYSVSGAGDLNNDSYDDVIVGAYTSDGAGTDAGRAYIYLGGANMDSTPDVVLDGEAAGDYFGFSVSGAGDVNKDGFDDVIVGAYQSDARAFNSGKAYIYFGGTSINDTADMCLYGAPSPDFFGYSVSGAGDVNNDGYDDVIVGAPAHQSQFHIGEVYVFKGGAPMDGNPILRLRPSSDHSQFGSSVSGAGDFNNDGYDDILVGDFYDDTAGECAGRAVLYYGASVPDINPDFVLNGTSGSVLGYSVSDAGDMDDDGYDDIIVGAPTQIGGESQNGHAYVYSAYSGIKRTGVRIDQVEVWEYPSYFHSSAVSRDFGAELTGIVRKCPTAGTDKYGIEMVDVPVVVSAGGQGKLTLKNLKINYSMKTPVADFADALNKYISTHKSQKDSGGNLTVPISIVSATPGRLNLCDLLISVDEAPRLISPIPDVELPEGTANPALLDILGYFEDDYGGKDRLTFTIAAITNDSFVRVELIDNRYLSADDTENGHNDNWTGSMEVIIAVLDQWGSRGLSNRFRISVTNVNDAPVITSVPPANATGGQRYNYQIAAVDGDNDNLDFGLASGPANMTVNRSTGLVTWVPTRGGSYDVSVTASDGKATARQSFRITVPNRPPEVVDATVPVAYTGQPYSYTIPAFDHEGDILTFSPAMVPAGMFLEPDTGKLSWTPSDLGDFPVSVKISDGLSEIKHEFIIKVVQGNRAPKFTTSPVATAIAGMLYTYDADALDLDKDRLTFAPVAVPSGMAIDNSTGVVSWLPHVGGNFSVKIRVFDGRGGEAFQEFTIRVSEPVRPRVNLLSHKTGQTIRGTTTLFGTVTKGSLEVAYIQVKIDDREWTEALGNYSWSFRLDTKPLSDGRHTFEFRAYDGRKYSDVVRVELNVDNSAGRGFIPGFADILVPMAVAAALAMLGRRRKTGR